MRGEAVVTFPQAEWDMDVEARHAGIVESQVTCHKSHVKSEFLPVPCLPANLLGGCHVTCALCRLLEMFPAQQPDD
jgi:hypothetical protein